MSFFKFIPLFLLVLSSSSFAADSVTLSEFLNLVKEKNLDLKINEAKVKAVEAESRGIRLPAPMISLDQMHEDVGNTAQGYEISQTIPFPTKISSDSSARKYAAKSQAEVNFASQSEVIAAAKFLYISLWAEQEKISFLQMKQKILEDHIRLSRSTARSDNFATIHVLKVESDLDLLRNDIEAETQTLKEKQLQVANFLNEDPESFRIVAKEPVISEIPRLRSTNDIHQLKIYQFNAESMKSRENEARSSWLPDFSLTYKEMGPTSMASRYNEIMVGVSLPFLFFWQPDASVKVASAQAMQAQFEFEKKKRAIDIEIDGLMSRAQSLRKQVLSITENTIPRAEKRMKLVHNLAPRDMESLEDHRETMESLPELKIKALELRLQYEDAIANLEKYLMEKENSHE